MSNLDVVVRLVLITVLAGAIGYERERHGRAAGFRTHIFVGLGSCLVMLTGLYLVDVMKGNSQFDPTRMAAQVVSGIGFLGAGTILRFRASVRGLTTAASLWVVGGIGLAVGAGFLLGAGIASAIVVVSLFGFARLERAMRRDWYQTLVIETKASGDNLAKIRDLLGAYDVEIRDLRVIPVEHTEYSRLEFDIKLISDQPRGEILNGILQLEDIRKVHWA